MSIPKTVVEFVDTGAGPAHVVREIRINGVPVLIKEDPFLYFGHGSPTELTITILPTEIHFNPLPSPKE